MTEPPYSGVLAYPRPEGAPARAEALRAMGVREVSFEGGTRLGGLPVLGKGHAGVVVLARGGDGRVMAAKIRRPDSRRDSLSGEAKLQGEANRAGVGPRIYSHTGDVILMEYVGGESIGRWARGLARGEAAASFGGVVRRILEDCLRLDRAGLDHGELSRVHGHVIVDGSRPTIVDFESASTSRRPANVTSAVQGIFIGGIVAGAAARALRLPARGDILSGLRRYKRERTRDSFDSLLRILGV